MINVLVRACLNQEIKEISNLSTKKSILIWLLIQVGKQAVEFTVVIVFGMAHTVNVRS